MDRDFPAAGEVWRICGAREKVDAYFVNLRREGAAEISLREEDALLERELREDDSDFIDRFDSGRTVVELFAEVSDRSENMIEQLGLDALRDSGFRVLSTGERRRVMIGRALLVEPALLLGQDVFDGVDQVSRKRLVELLEEARQRCGILISGEVGDVEIDRIVDLGGDDGFVRGRLPDERKRENYKGQVTLSLRDVTVTHGGRKIIDGLSWEVRQGETWQVSGPNGCGKSTLVGLVTGDHPQCFSNEVEVFGMRRGGGESIWDVKRRIGLVSPSLQQNYRVAATVLEVVVSGLFDSVGVYKDASTDDIERALAWLDYFGLREKRNAPLSSLDHGARRLVLIARALVKDPQLLILDEPCQALSESVAAGVFETIERLISEGRFQVILINHDLRPLAGVTHELNCRDGSWERRTL